jgi:hypothetical protein
MTLLIAVLIIKGLNMGWWWYAFAGFVWLIHLYVAYWGRDKNFEALSKQNIEFTDEILEEMEG